MSEPITKITTPMSLNFTITPGEATARFLRGLKEGRILGQRCPKCAKVYVPPRGSCPMCAIPTVEEVELAHTGTVTSFCVVNIPFHGSVQELPYVCASVLFDGADISTFGLVQEIPYADVHMGLRVEAVWVAPEDRGYSMDNIKYFRPTGEADAAPETYKGTL